MTTYWICLRWRVATVGAPDCPCCQYHVRVDPYVDEERRVWWQLRMQQKPLDVQDAVGIASWGLRDYDWPRVVDTLVEGARQRSTGFYVFTVEPEPIYYEESESPIYYSLAT